MTVSADSRTADSWGLLACLPERVHPRWQVLLGEAERVFAAAWAQQDAAEADLRRQWDRNPAARAAQLLTGELGRAWTADEVTDAELAACDQLLGTWRHPGWPSRLDYPRLAEQRDRSRAQRALVAQILNDLAAGEQATPAARGRMPRTARPARTAATRPAAGQPPPTRAAPRAAHAILQSLADDRLAALHFPVQPVPYTGWHEWRWIRDLIRERTSAPDAGSSPPARSQQKQATQARQLRPRNPAARDRQLSRPAPDDIER